MQEKEEEMEQRTGKLLRENQQLKENCTDAQAELQREQVQMLVRSEHEDVVFVPVLFSVGSTTDYNR